MLIIDEIMKELTDMQEPVFSTLRQGNDRRPGASSLRCASAQERL
jgi:hypothetical protein